MPLYLLHGFRWTRLNIRIRIILYDLEDAASEWIMAPATSKALLKDFYQKYNFLPPCRPPSPFSSQLDTKNLTSFPGDKPIDDLTLSCAPRIDNSRVSLRSPDRKQKAGSHISSHEKKGKQEAQDEQLPQPYESSLSLSKKKSINFNDWSPIKLVEQYDPDEKYICSQPFAYVADYLVKIDLSVALNEEMRKYANFRSEQSRCPEEKRTGSSSMIESDLDRKLKEQNLNKVEEDWFERLRNELEKDSDIGWYVVYCGDQEREIPAWAKRKLSEDDLNIEAPPKTPWSAGFKFLFKGKRNDVEN